MSRTRYYWEFALVEAILEYDHSRARVKTSQARDAMNERLKELAAEVDSNQELSVEKRAILTGLAQLAIHLNRVTAA